MPEDRPSTSVTFGAMKTPTDLNVEDYGWVKIDGAYLPVLLVQWRTMYYFQRYIDYSFR